MFKFIDLFAGIGGFHHALSSLGGECVLACEFDKDCEKVYRSTFPETRFVSNIREITRNTIEDEDSVKSNSEIEELVPDHDVLCAGFPCQPFSLAGKGLGFSDRTRGTLFFDIMQIVKAKKPRYVLLENVRNITSAQHKDTWRTIISSLREEGYVVSEKPTILSPHLIPENEGGAPQVRDRVFIAATLDTTADAFYLERDYFKDSHDPFKDWSIEKYLSKDNEVSNLKKYTCRDEEVMWFEAWNYLVENINQDKIPGVIWISAFNSKPKIDDSMAQWRIDYLKRNSVFYNENRKFLNSWLNMKWGRYQQKVTEFPPSRQKLEFQAMRLHPTQKGRTIRDLVIQFRQSGIRVKPPNYLPALVAINQTSIIGPEVKPGINEYRRITPYEASKLQGIDGAVFTRANADDRAIYKQLGNGVNVGVVTYVAKRFLQSLI